MEVAVDMISGSYWYRLCGWAAIGAQIKGNVILYSV